MRATHGAPRRAFVLTQRRGLQAQLLGPSLEGRLACVGLKTLRADPLSSRRQGLQDLLALAHVAFTGRGEEGDFLARKVRALNERVDDRRRHVPPNREADEDLAVARQVGKFARNGRARG